MSTKTIVVGEGRKPQRVWFSRLWPIMNMDYVLLKDSEDEVYVPPCAIEIAKGHYALCDGHHRVKRMVSAGRKAALMWVLQPWDGIGHAKGCDLVWNIQRLCTVINDVYILSDYNSLRQSMSKFAGGLKKPALGQTPWPLQEIIDVRN